MTKLPAARDLSFTSRCGLDWRVASCQGSTKCWFIKTLLPRVRNCGLGFIIIMIVIHESIYRRCLRGRLIAGNGRDIFFPPAATHRRFSVGEYPRLEFIGGGSANLMTHLNPA